MSNHTCGVALFANERNRFDNGRTDSSNLSRSLNDLGRRICIARAAFEDSEVVLLDDPLSAVDALVGHHLLQNCILSGPLAERTRILVTHPLDVLPQADLVLVMDRDDNNEAHIVQRGT